MNISTALDLVNQYDNNIMHTLAKLLKFRYGEQSMGLAMVQKQSHNGVNVIGLHQEKDHLSIPAHAPCGNAKCSITWQGEIVTRLMSNDCTTIILSTDEIDVAFTELAPDYCSLLSLPLRDEEETTRWVWLMSKSDGEFDPAVSQQMILLVNLAYSHWLRHHNNQCLREANQWIRKKIDDLAHLQQQLLPSSDTKIKGIRFATSYRVCEKVGGDYYELAGLNDLFEKDKASDSPDYWGLMIADATGHGALAAVEMAMFDAILRTYRPVDNTSAAAGVWNYINQYLFTRVIRGTFITAFALGYRPNINAIIYSNAGHPLPLLKRKGDACITELDDARGIPLAVLKEAQWENAQIPFNQGDMLLLYTDGVTEALSPDGEPFGIDRLKKIFLTPDTQPDEMINKIETAIDKHQQKLARKDDQTVIIVELEAE